MEFWGLQDLCLMVLGAGFESFGMGIRLFWGSELERGCRA